MRRFSTGLLSSNTGMADLRRVAARRRRAFESSLYAIDDKEAATFTNKRRTAQIQKRPVADRMDHSSSARRLWSIRLASCRAGRPPNRKRCQAATIIMQ